MHPAEHQRKRNQRRDEAAPHDQKVRQPARESALENESLFDEIGRDRLCRAGRILQELFALQIKIPTASPVNPGRGTLQPDSVAKHNRSECDYAGDCVTEQRRIVMFETARADYDQQRQQERSCQGQKRRSAISD